MARAGLRKVSRYAEPFKATAVKLSSLPGVLIQDVAAALVEVKPVAAIESSAVSAASTNLGEK